MGVLQALIDTRKMKRMAALMTEGNSDKAAEMLQNILNEALSIQMTGNIRSQTNAVQEIKSLRNAMVAGSIQAGKMSTRMIGAYTLAAEEMERETLKLSQKMADDNKVDLNFISDRLPSMDSLTSALITANPFMGYSVKIARDIGKELKNRKSQKLQAERSRLELIQQQQLRIADLLQEVEAKDDSGSDSESDSEKHENLPVLQPIETDQNWKTFFEPYSDSSIRLLEDIENNTFKLARVWDDTHERISRIEEEQAKEDARLKKVQEEEEKRLVEEENRRREFEREQNQNPTPDLPIPAQSEEEQKGGFASMLGGLLGSLAGGGLMAAITGIGSLFAGITSIGAVAIGILKRGTPLAAIMAVYDFLDGFFTAKDILGKSSVTIRERIETGISSIISGFISLGDTILEFFGVDMIKENKKQLTKKLSLALHSAVDDFVDFAKSMWDGIVDFFISVKDEIMKFFDDPVKYMEEFTRDFIDNSYVAQSVGNLTALPDYQNNPGQRQLDQIKAAQRLSELSRNGGVVGESKTNYSAVQVAAAEVQSKKENAAKASAPIVVNAPQSSTVNNTNQVSGGSSPRNTDPFYQQMLHRNFQTSN